MDWNIIKKRGILRVSEKDYCLEHLKDEICAFTIPASGNYQEVSFSALIQYSSHCVSWGPKEQQDIDFSVHGEDKRIIDDKGIHRCFCEERYALSHYLPDILRSLPDKKCLFTGYENWLIIEIIEPDGTKRDYEVYFNITRQGKRFLRIYVESAYVRSSEQLKTRPVKFARHMKVRGRVLLVKKLRGESIKRPVR